MTFYCRMNPEYAKRCGVSRLSTIAGKEQHVLFGAYKECDFRDQCHETNLSVVLLLLTHRMRLL